MPSNFDPYYKWLGISPAEQPPSHYRLLGIPVFTADADVIENTADQRMAHLRSVLAGIAITVTCFLLGLLVLFSDDMISAQEPGRRQPEPIAAAQEEAQKLITKLYKTDFDAAKTSEQKLTLAKKLQRIGNETQSDPVGRYVLWRMAADIAVQEGEAQLALQGIDLLQNNYELDALKMKASVLNKVCRVAKRSQQHCNLVPLFAELLDACVTADRYEIALPLAEIALVSARESKDRIFLIRATNRKKDIEELRRRFEELKEHLATLERSPTDSVANLHVGKYRCLDKGNWQQGIPMLALGSDAALKTLASLELAERPDVIALGDGWWEQADKETGLFKDRMRQHAVDCYRLALPSLTGLTKSKVEARVNDVSPILKKHSDRITNSIGMQLAFIPEGEFMMGASSTDENALPEEKPQHLVRITRPYYMGIHEITQEQYERIMGNNPSSIKGKQNPVESVTWFEAVEFCQKLTSLPDERKSNRKYRLPTDAEWEYACRAGSKTLFYFGDDASQLPRFAWYRDNSIATTHSVGQKEPNAWGLYDMNGNVAEWCWDGFDPSYYAKSPLENPEGPKENEQRVLRGSGRKGDAPISRSSYRRGMTPQSNGYIQGFRVVCSQ